MVCFQSSYVTTLAAAGTTLLSLSFVFAVTTQEFLGSCIFLFVKHPYDVGDRVDIHGTETEPLIVERISLLYTVFTRIDKMQVVQVPNIQLNNLWIENVTRSKAMREIIEINVSYDTTFEDLELLREEMEKFVRAPENSRDFQPDITISVSGVGNLDKLTLQVTIMHKSNWHNEAVRCARRSKFMCALALAVKSIPIFAPGGGSDALGAPSNPTYSVAVDDSFAADARAKASEEKAKNRLAVKKQEQMDSPSNVPAANPAEQQAVENLNTRDPLAEAVDDWGYDNTLNSRDASMERKRSRDIDTVRSQLSRNSTRGRRKPGECLPTAALGDTLSGVSPTQSKPSRTFSYDVEAGLAPGSQLQSQQPAQHVYGGVSQPGSSSAYPMSTAYSPASPTAHTVIPTIQEAYALEPMGSGATGVSGSTGASPASGSRPRGATVSRALAHGQAANAAEAQHQAQNAQNQGRAAGY